MRFAMTARTVARTREKNQEINELTQKNIDKVTRYRAGGEKALEDMIKSLSSLKVVKNRQDASGDPANVEKRWGGRV
jgi:large subunit ribosomal protein L17